MNDVIGQLQREKMKILRDLQEKTPEAEKAFRNAFFYLLGVILFVFLVISIFPETLFYIISTILVVIAVAAFGMSGLALYTNKKVIKDIQRNKV
jgi:VIT1/CCC1 family predicted Fe2+/Mn2+ transporter